ncbi:hypothetical protein V2J09_021694 [Rumex salicifolius]
MFELSRGVTTACIAICVLMVACSSSTIEARVHHHKWEVKYEYKSPDCFKKPVITINGLSPGPTIRARQGDTIVVEVLNSMGTENLAIHWHGIKQKGTPWSDGTEGVTQCPLSPGDTFVYKFVVDKAGTFLYHAHYGMQRADGVNGMIEVSLPEGQSEPFSYDVDRRILLTDWYHKSASEQAMGLASKPFVWVNEPQSLLINGRGQYNCSIVKESTINNITVCNQTTPECAPFVLHVVPGKTYRLRLGSLTSLSALSFEIEGHNLTVVEADGNYVEPFQVKSLFIYSGETYSVLFTADQNSTRNYWITTNVVSRKPGTPTGRAILNYYPNRPEHLPPTQPTTGPLWNDTAPRMNQSLSLRARQGHVETPPATSDRQLIFLNTQDLVNGFLRWSVNSVSLALPSTPYLVAIKENLRHVFDQRSPPDRYNNLTGYDINKTMNQTGVIGSGIYRLEFDSTVDIILQNANSRNNKTSETHPWHLHGHDFWVLGYGKGKFDPKTDPKSFNLVNPAQKNTVPVHPYGWTAIRFKANNPGTWLFHCHIDAHFAMGMGVVFEEGVDRVGRLPRSIMGCGATKRLIRN